MAIIPRGLGVILTLWIGWQRSAPLNSPEAPAFGAWWGTPQSKIIARKADSARRAGDLSAAEGYYQQGYTDAIRRHDERAMVGYINGIAACQLTRLEYPKALKTLLEAKAHAKSIGDKAALGAVAVNLSSLYFQVYDFESALREAEEGRAAVQTSKGRYYLPNLLLQMARLHEKLEQDGMAASLYREGLEAAKQAGDRQLEGIGLDLLGETLLRQGHIKDAENAIREGIKLRERFAPKDLGYSWRWLAEIELARGELADASLHNAMALESHVKVPEYLLKNQRGRIKMAAGDTVGALVDLREAVDLTTQWRTTILPASGSLTATNENLERIVFYSFIEAAAAEALRTGDERWARESFEAVELNRAASLRESLVLADAWHRRVPAEYWETLGRLRVLESKMVGGIQNGVETRRLLLELNEMEAKAGLGFLLKNSESFSGRTSLIHFQQGLGNTEVLLSFHLGDRESYLWEVTKTTFRLRRIASKKEIQTQVMAWADAVRAGRAEAVELGEKLYQELFGQLEQDAVAKSAWLLSLDGTLFQVPFAALVTEQKGGKVRYLVSSHSVQTIPGALLLSKVSEAGTGGFLGIGDPIYNVADPRWKAEKSVWKRFLQSANSEGQFGRLVGSGKELSTSAANWGAQSVLLEGSAASRDRFLGEAAKSPGIIHLATHFVARGNTSLIAFGLGPQGKSELLTTTDISSMRVPGAIVAMTGCDTGLGLARDGAGLQGLTRAWQMAGASAVIATSWPVRDTNGDIFASFYRELRHHTPAEALRLSQLEMLTSGSWRATPSYWAAYQITGGGR